MASLIFAQALSILLVGGLRFGPAVVLAGAPRGLWVAAVALLAIGTLLALRFEQGQGQAPWACRGRILLWLVFPGASAVNWGLGQEQPDRGAGISILAVVLGLVIAVLFWRRTEWAGREASARAWMIGGRWLVLPTAAVVVAGVGYSGQLPGNWLGYASYPLYGGIQLAAALVLPWTQWARDGVEPRRRVAASALLFALVHWPNPFATVVTGFGMLLWASAWRAGSPLLPLALSLGIMATVVTQSLPAELTAHMRIAAPYSLKERELARSRGLDERAARICREAAGSEAEGLRPWLGRALHAATGRETDPILVDGFGRIETQDGFV
jgi:predicted membrane protein